MVRSILTKIMFPILLLLSSPTPFYDLIPPFHESDIDEIGNWSLKGTSSNLKDSIRLTSALPKLNGYLCQRIPFSFIDWAIHFNLSFSMQTSGDSFYLLFTDSFCPSFNANLTGFSLFFDIKANKAHLSILKNEYIDNSSNVETENIDFSSLLYPLKVVLTRRLDFLTVSLFNGSIYRELFFVEIPGMIDNGYLSFVGKNSDKYYNNIDIKYVNVYPYSNNITQMNVFLMKDNINYSKTNKKRLESNYLRRKQNKENRRRKIFPYVNKLIKELSNNSFVLNAEQRQNVSMAIELVNEAYNRAKETITLSQLSQFIEMGIDPMIDTAVKKVKMQSVKIEQLRNDLDFLYSDLNDKMMRLTKDAENEMKTIMVQMLVAAKDLNIDHLHEKEAGKLLDKAQVPVSDSVVTLLIYSFCIIETVLYVIFFISKRKYINRKYD